MTTTHLPRLAQTASLAILLLILCPQARAQSTLAARISVQKIPLRFAAQTDAAGHRYHPAQSPLIPGLSAALEWSPGPRWAFGLEAGGYTWAHQVDYAFASNTPPDPTLPAWSEFRFGILHYGFLLRHAIPISGNLQGLVQFSAARHTWLKGQDQTTYQDQHSDRDNWVGRYDRHFGYSSIGLGASYQASKQLRLFLLSGLNISPAGWDNTIEITQTQPLSWMMQAGCAWRFWQAQ